METNGIVSLSNVEIELGLRRKKCRGQVLGFTCQLV